MPRGNPVGRAARSARRLLSDYRAPAIDERNHRLWSADLIAQITAVSEWVQLTDAGRDLSVSVITASKNRAHLLRRSIDSVLAQTHPRVELVVVNDGSTDGTAELLAGVDDARVQVVETDGVGLSAARNRGLAAASGSVIAYLDDDNVMHPEWCRAIAWAFTRWPAVELLYGVRLVEDMDAIHGVVAGADEWPARSNMPMLDFPPFDRATLERVNYLDINAMAHRAGLPEARFDETTSTVSDWDFLLRLTEQTAAFAFPAISCAYGTRHEGRMLALADLDAESEWVRSLLRRRKGGAGG